MAAAVAALDGTDAGGYQEQPYMALESGVLPESVFSDIADAIRGQNGLSTLYAPGDMAAAILAPEWDVGYKIRALLLDDGTLEINYYERRTSVTGGHIVQVFEVDPAGYSSASARSYDSIKLLVKKVYIDSTIAGLGITNCNYWFNAFSNCTEVRGFENLSGMTSANQMFTSCGSLETIYATSFSNSGLSGSLMSNSCTNLTSVNGLGNLSGVRSMRYTFSSCAFTTIDFRGFDPSTLTDLFYTFSGCSHMTTIYADSTWALPTSGITGSQCFYSCSSLVGGNGTAWASSKTAYTYFRIDTASTPGYVTVA
jgi:hypothetical protein